MNLQELVPPQVGPELPISIPDQRQWFDDLRNSIEFWAKVSQGAENALQELVKFTCSNWYSISLEVRSTETLENFLIETTGRSKKHIQNMIDTYHTYNDGYEIPPYVDTDKVGTAKLIVAKAAVKKDLMEELHWQAMIDPSVSSTEFRKMLPSIRTQSKRKLELRFYEREGEVWATDEKDHTLVAIFAEPETSLQRQAIKFVRRGLGL